MLEDKRQDLQSEKRKKLLRRLVDELSKKDPNFYYRSTSDIAAQIEAYISNGTALNGEERSLISGLARRDVEILLSLN